MNKNYTFDRTLSNMTLNLEIMEELEIALGELQNTISASRYTAEKSSTSPDLELHAVAA